MKDEFNRKKEFDYSKKVKEFKRFEAVEYYKPKEIAPNPPEIKKYKEGFNDNLKDNKDFKKAPNERLDKNKQNNQNRQESTESNQSSNINNQTETANNLNQGDASMAADSVSATSTAAANTASVVSTSVSLTGGVSIISAVAIVGVGTANAIINAKPEVEFLSIETGTDYLYYEFNVSKLAEDSNYVVRVYNEVSSQEFEITEDGIQKQIVTGLIPFRNYTVAVCGTTEDFGYVEYYRTTATTQKLECPKACFDITKTEDEANDLFNIQYNVYISDYYNTGYQTYLEIYYDDKLKLTDNLLSEAGYFKGSLENIYDGVQIYLVAYTYYYDELTKIGEFGYEVTYPEFVKERTYDSTFTVKDPEIKTTDTGYTLVLDTGFDSKNENEAYQIDVYKTGSYKTDLTSQRLTVLESDLVKSFEAKNRMISIDVSGDLEGVEIYLTPVKYVKDRKYTYQRTLIGTYSFAEAREYAKEPTATVLFDRILDEDKQEFNLDYMIQIDDAFRIGSNFRTEVYVGDQLVSEESITKKNSTGHLKDLYNGSTITVLVFTEINGDIAVIGEGEYTVEYPQGFGKFQSSYELLRENVSVDLVNQQLTVDTKFNQKDENESYRLELYLDDELFDSVESEAAVVSFDGFVGTSRNFKLVFVPLSNGIDVTSINQTELDVEIEEPFEDVSIAILDRTLNVSLSAFDYTNTEFTARVLITFTDDSQGERTFTFTGSLNRSLPLTEYGPYVEVKSVEVEVIYNDTNMIAYYSITNDKVELTTDTYSVSEDASISIPYEISLDSSVTFEGYSVRFNSGTLEEFDTLGKSGVLKIEELTNSTISYDGFVSYSDNGVLVTKLVKPSAIELDAVVDIESLAFLNSYNCMYFTYDVRIDDVNITKDIGLKVLHGDKDDYSGKIYSIQEYDVNTDFESGSSKYDEKIGYFYIHQLLSNSGKDFLQFKTENPLFKLNQDIFTFASNSLYSKNSLVENKAGVYSDIDSNYHIYYVVEQKDGKYHYYINTNYSGKTDGQIFQKIYYSYTENGYKKYGHVDIGIETSYELILDHEVDSLYHTCVLRYVRDYYLNSEVYNPIETLYEYKAIYTSFEGTLEDGKKLYSYNEEDGTYQEASPQSLGLYIYNGSDYELSNALAFDSETTYYKIDATGQGYSEIALSELELYRMEMGYDVTRDTQLEYGKTYYILDQTSGEYIVATPKNLGLQVTTGVSFKDSQDTTFDTNKVYYKYDATLKRYDHVYPLMLGLYVYNNEEYVLAEDYSFESTIAYYYFDGENYVLATPQSLGLKELNDIGYEDTEDEAFAINYVTSKLLEMESKNQANIISNQQLYYDGEESTHLSFNIDYDYLGSDNVSVTIDNQEYVIPLYAYEDLESHASELESNYATYQIEESTYRASLYCDISNGKITSYSVELMVFGNHLSTPLVSPKIKYTYNPKAFTNAYGIDSVIHVQEENLIEYSLSYDEPVISGEYLSGSDQYEIQVAYDFDCETDMYVSWRIEAYEDANYENYVSSSDDNSIDSETMYYSVSKERNILYLKAKIIIQFDGQELVLREDNLGLWKAPVISSPVVEHNVEVVRLNGVNHSSSVNYQTFTLIDGEEELTEGLTGELEEGDFSIDINYDSSIVKYVFRIYDKNTNVLLDEYEYSPMITLGNYQYVEGNDYITLDYNIDVPSGYTFSSVMTLDDEQEFNTASGTLTITELESNILMKQFRVILLDENEKEFIYEISLEYEFDVDIDFDYQIVGYNTSEFDFTSGSSAKYDESTGILYVYGYNSTVGDAGYFDEEGNAAPESLTDSYNLARGIYDVVGKAIFKVGCFTVPYDYSIRVTKSGLSYKDNISNHPTQLADEYTITSENLSNGFTMTMYEVENGFVVVDDKLYPNTTCELVFEVTYGNHTIEKTVTYETGASAQTLNDAFDDSLQETITKNSDGTINLTIPTGFDSEANPDYYYQVILYDYRNLSASNVVYTSDYYNTSEVTIENLENIPYRVDVVLFRKNNGNYMKWFSGGTNMLKQLTNSPLTEVPYIAYDFNNSAYNLEYKIDRTKIDNDKTITIHVADTDQVIELINENYTITDKISATVTTTDDLVTIKLTYNGTDSGSNLDGSITLDQGNDEMGYVTTTYTITY